MSTLARGTRGSLRSGNLYLDSHIKIQVLPALLLLISCDTYLKVNHII